MISLVVQKLSPFATIPTKGNNFKTLVLIVLKFANFC